jgi:hypothetical protein
MALKDFFEWYQDPQGYRRQQNIEQGREEYRGLLSRYASPLEGPVGPGGEEPGYGAVLPGMQGGFFQEMAGIPGYEAIAAQLMNQRQAGHAAMDRQRQQQQYGATAPITPYQQAVITQNADKMAAQQEEWDRNYQLALAQGNQERAQALLAQQAPYYGMNAQQRTDYNMQTLALDDSVSTLQDVSDYVSEANWEQQARNPSVLNTVRQAFTTESMNLYRKLTEAGAIQEADLELFERMGAGELDIFNLTDTQKNRVRYVASEAKQYRRRHYLSGMGIEPHEIKPGSSRLAGVVGPNIKPVGKLSPITENPATPQAPTSSVPAGRVRRPASEATRGLLEYSPPTGGRYGRNR